MYLFVYLFPIIYMYRLIYIFMFLNNYVYIYLLFISLFISYKSWPTYQVEKN